MIKRFRKLALFPGRHRETGHFLYCAGFGLGVLILALMAEEPGLAHGVLLGSLFLSAIGLRFLAPHSVSRGPSFRQEIADYRQELHRLSSVFDSLPQPVLLLDPRGGVEAANSASTAYFGMNCEGRHISSVVRNPKALDLIREAKSSEEPIETEITLLGPMERTALFYAVRLRAPSGETEDLTLLMLRDRTEQKKLEQMRTDFVANASHELRTPLTSMGGYVETLQGHARDDPEAQARFLKIMAGQIDRMLRLVEDLIGLSAIELKENRPPSDEVALGSLAQSVVESLQPLLEREQGHVILDLPSERVVAIGERDELFRVMANLVENAVKYGRPSEEEPAVVTITAGRGVPPFRDHAHATGDSPVQIAVRIGIPLEELVFVRISDRGNGIDPNDLPRLTERFYRVNPQLSRSKGGTGLGLAIVKHILYRHRGGMRIESVPGEGASFCFFLPSSRKTAVTASREKEGAT
ncbi:two component sensor histidine kinase phoR [Parvularcula bermudensis HTCC2503]|uniref:histidine kinase n=1 Tax=Parvularcula bermudensis (strain ATCC BAA-594 / HTCC2503 / KCTC 12087) TaxID=314260 RepID=E0THQ3_PARBH|nr:ATP-binding protein [Parvularcula bermudensis]ADM09349.1 two component sensor histidine kinase phoR [Parvularcula bermudensis HTCC2503]